MTTKRATSQRAKPYWTVASTHFAQEQRAAHHIERQGFPVYLPETTAISPKGRERRELLFPGYVFIHVFPSDQWRSLSFTRGVQRLFTQNEIPSRIGDSEIAYFRALEDERGLVVLPSPFGVDDHVVVTGGTLAGARGIVRYMLPGQRCRVLLTLLGRQLEAEIDRRAMELA